MKNVFYKLLFNPINKQCQYNILVLIVLVTIVISSVINIPTRATIPLFRSLKFSLDRLRPCTALCLLDPLTTRVLRAARGYW